MDTKIKRIHELLEELAEATKDAFPDYSRIGTTCSSDGYRNFTITKWGEEKKDCERTKRRVLYDQTKVQDEWMKDRSADQNKYYDELGVLLKDDCVR